MRKLKRALSYLLVLIMLFQLLLIPMSVSGENAAEPGIVRELCELRNTNAETYLRTDGLYECVVFSEDKYFLAPDGFYSEIDNSIIKTSFLSNGQSYTYRNAANSYRVCFSDSATPAVLISNENKSVKFAPVNSNRVRAIAGSSAKTTTEISGYSLRGDNFITYPGLFSGVDFIYSANNDCVKEFIVLNDNEVLRSYSFAVTSEGCSISNNNGEIEFIDSVGNCVFELGKLFAVDSAGAYTEELEYSVVEYSATQAIITISISEEYLNDSERVFPVLIDPSIMITGKSRTKDTYISKKYPNTNYYMNNYLRTGCDDAYGTRRVFINFDIPTSVSKNISSANIRIKKHSGLTSLVYAYRVLGSWTSSTATWNNAPSYSSTNVSRPAKNKGNNWYWLDVTRTVSDWQKGKAANYGFMLKEATENDTSRWTTFYSSEADSPNKPELRIVYVPYDSVLMAYSESGVDRNEYFQNVSPYISQNRKGNVLKSNYTSCSKATAISYLQSTLVFFTHTHGTQNGIYLGNDVSLTSSDLNGKDLSNLRFALLLTCNGGTGGYSATRVTNGTPVNIVEQLVICGAESVIAFQGKTYVSDCNKFADRFAQATMQGGANVYYAARHMDCTDMLLDMSQLAVIGGNGTLTLNW